MAGGIAVATSSTADYGGSLTFAVILTCIMAASGGLIFGYDIGVSGGVTSMESFLGDFFPVVLRRMAEIKAKNVYCVYDNQKLTSFTSSLYIAGLAASLVASRLTKAIGRQAIMLLGGAMFFAGAALNGAAVNISMLIIGRMLLGFGVGFTNQATPVYLAEMSPPRWRGAFTAGFQFFLSLGNLLANLANYWSSHLKWGWRLSLGLAAAPATIIILGLAAAPATIIVIGALFISDTPSSLVLRGKLDAAKAALHRIRGPNADIDTELKEVIKSVERAEKYEEGAFRRIIMREYRPQLVMSVAVALFFQLTGVIALAFFSPLLFRIVGFGSDGALIGAVILGAVNLGSITMSTFTIDRLGRRPLFMIGGIVMILTQVAMAWILGVHLIKDQGTMPHRWAVALLVLVCFQAAGFGFSWGPLNWVIPGEIFPVEIRSAGNGITVAVGLGCTFIQTQTFLAMLCTFQYATFAYYAGWVLIMTSFIFFFMPETKGIPLESMSSVWAGHWYWSRFVKKPDPFAESL